MRQMMHLKIGRCENCGFNVYSGEPFDIMVFSWGEDFPDDKPGRRMIVLHRDCNKFANHSKD